MGWRNKGYRFFIRIGTAKVKIEEVLIGAYGILSPHILI